jgi:hypothetical protein
MGDNKYYDKGMPEEDDYLEVAKEELKRVEHQVYVTLKYTRTVDVLLNVQQRMIDAYQALFNALLSKKLGEEEIPGSIIEKTNKIKELYNEPQVLENVEIYHLLRKVVRAKNITKLSEYRRPVALITVIDGQEVKIDIDLVTHYYAVLISFYKYVETIIQIEKQK